MGESGLTRRDLGEFRFPADPGFAKVQARGCGDLKNNRRIAIQGLFWAIHACEEDRINFRDSDLFNLTPRDAIVVSPGSVTAKDVT